MEGPDDSGEEPRRRKGRGPVYFVLMTAIVIGVILVALYFLRRIGNAIP